MTSARALSHLRICDFTGLLAGAGATRTLAAFGAQVIRVEDPVRRGRWDLLRGAPPYVDERRGLELGGAFNNHNVEKLGVTINLKSEEGRELLKRLVAVSDVVTENFAGGVLARMGFSFDDLRAIREDIIYVSNCGFGHSGPYAAFKSWGPIVQAVCGLTYTSGLPDQPPAGWGYSYMDNQGAYFMVVAVLAAVVRRNRTGEGQWVDMSCAEAGANLLGPVVLDHTVNGRTFRRPGMPHSNRSQFPAMAPHNIYPAQGEDEWVAIACRNDADWELLGGTIGEPWTKEARFHDLTGRLGHEDELDQLIGTWTATHPKHLIAERLQSAAVPAAAVLQPRERVDHDANTEAWGLWPTVKHPEIGEVRVDGIPLHLSLTDWTIERGAPLLGEHNDVVFRDILGLTDPELAALREKGVV